MATWPPPDTHRKDCNSNAEVDERLYELDKNRRQVKQQKSRAKKITNTGDVRDRSSTDLTNLDDRQLKDLLEEVYQYKSPKDREGKSQIFKELLKEAEPESESGEESQPTTGEPSRRRKKDTSEGHRAVSTSRARGGSLQNLVHTYTEADGSRLRKKRRELPSSVSVRTREGGSLDEFGNELPQNTAPGGRSRRPSAFLDVAQPETVPNVRGNKTAKRHVSSSLAAAEPAFPAVENASSAGNVRVDRPHTVIELGDFCLDSISDDYTAGATELQVFSSSRDCESEITPLLKDGERHSKTYYGSGSAGWSPVFHTVQNGLKGGSYAGDFVSEPVDVAISLPLQDQSLKSLKAAGYTNGVEDIPILELCNETDNVRGKLRKRERRSMPCEGKSLDENGNPLNITNVPCELRINSRWGRNDVSEVTESGRKQKIRRPKQRNNEKNVIKSEDILGYIGDRSLDNILHYLEEDNKGKLDKEKGHRQEKERSKSKEKHTARGGATDDEDESHSKGSRTAELKRSSSLEVISPRKSNKPSASSYLESGSFQRRHQKALSLEESPVIEQSLWETVKPAKTEETHGFHVVTKKSKKRRKFDDSRCRGMKKSFAFHGQEDDAGNKSAAMLLAGLPSTGRQRKSTSSMPASDHSESSDVDSVHSLPVSSCTPKMTVDKTSTSSGSTPHTSYADIAKMTGNGPRVSSQVNSSQTCAETSCKKDAATSTGLETDKGLPSPEKRMDDSDDYPALGEVDSPMSSEGEVSIGVQVDVRLEEQVNASHNEVTPVSSYVPPPSLPLQSQVPVSKLPAVVILDQPYTLSSATDEYTFGFDVNEELLALSERSAPVVEKTVCASVTKDFASLYRDDGLLDKSSFNYQQIVEYVGKAWDATLREHSHSGPNRTKVQFYSSDK